MTTTKRKAARRRRAEVRRLVTGFGRAMARWADARADEEGPTPETLAQAAARRSRFRVDRWLACQLEQGAIGQEHLRAAINIALARYLLTQPVATSTPRWWLDRVDNMGAAAPTLLVDLQQIYLRWCEACAAGPSIRAASGIRVTADVITIAVICEEQAPDRLVRLYGKRAKTITDLVVEGLTRFDEIHRRRRC